MSGYDLFSHRACLHISCVLAITCHFLSNDVQAQAYPLRALRLAATVTTLRANVAFCVLHAIGGENSLRFFIRPDGHGYR